MRSPAFGLLAGLLCASPGVALATDSNPATSPHAVHAVHAVHAFHGVAQAPWIGKVLEVTYPIGRFSLAFDRDGRTMRWHSLEDPALKDTVQYTARVVKPGVYSVNWYEPRYDEHAFQFQDWSTRTVHTVLIPSIPEIQSATGTFKVVGELP